MRRRVEVRLPEELYARVEEECRRSGLSLTQLVVRALESYLGAEGPQGLDALIEEVRRLAGEVRELRSLVRDLAEGLSEVELYLSSARVARPCEQVEGLPSYFKDNPWLDILRRRGHG